MVVSKTLSDFWNPPASKSYKFPKNQVPPLAENSSAMPPGVQYISHTDTKPV